MAYKDELKALMDTDKHRFKLEVDVLKPFEVFMPERAFRLILQNDAPKASVSIHDGIRG